MKIRDRQRGARERSGARQPAKPTRSGERVAGSVPVPSPLAAYRQWISALTEVIDEQRPGVDELLDRMTRRKFMARESGRFGR